MGEAWVQSLVDIGAAVVIAARDDDRSRETAHRIGESVDTTISGVVLAAQRAPLISSVPLVDNPA